MKTKNQPRDKSATELIRFRCTPLYKSLVRRKAKEARMSLSKFIIRETSKCA